LPVYPEILTRVKAGETLVDVGCFVGHDLRRLVYDDAPSKNLYGVDIVSHWDVGFEMFRDRGHFGATFIEADILSENPVLTSLKGKVDVLSVIQVLHQWQWDYQVKVAKVLSTFTRPGSLIVGNQIGNSHAQEVTLKSVAVPMWRHNPESFEKLWSQVGSETGTRWKAQSWMRSFEDMSWDPKDGAWMEDGVGIIEFVVKRVY
jgi:SAM-dependent methyltransferase